MDDVSVGEGQTRVFGEILSPSIYVIVLSTHGRRRAVVVPAAGTLCEPACCCFRTSRTYVLYELYGQVEPRPCWMGDEAKQLLLRGTWATSNRLTSSIDLSRFQEDTFHKRKRRLAKDHWWLCQYPSLEERRCFPIPVLLLQRYCDLVL